MKTSRKIITMLLALVMILSMVTSAFAAEGSSSPEVKGSITISNATPETTYSAYKIFDVTYNGDAYAYTISASNPWYTAVKYYVNGEGDTCGAPMTWDRSKVAASLDEVNGIVYFRPAEAEGQMLFDAADFAAFLNAYAKHITGGMAVYHEGEFAQMRNVGHHVTAGEDGTVTFNNLDLGYYFVTSGLGAVCSLTTTDPNATIIDKNQTPSWPEFPKAIVLKNEDGTETLLTTNDVAMGEEFPFRISVNATNYDGTNQIKEYIIKDTLPQGMVFTSPLTVKVIDSEGQVTDLSANFASLDTTTGSFAITIPWAEQGEVKWFSKYTSTATIVVEYTAMLNAEAAIGSANTNTAKVEFNYTDPKDDDPTTPDGELPEKTTDTFTTKIQIRKVDDGNEPLTGAAFKIEGESLDVVLVTGEVYIKAPERETGNYWRLTDGTYTQTDPATPGVDVSVYENPSESYFKDTKDEFTYANKSVDIEAFVDARGFLEFTGLGAGTYTITETVTPAGYNSIEPITVVIEFDEETQTFTADAPMQSSGENTFFVKITNVPGSQLPETGGMGTTLFYVLGGLMVLTAVVLLVTKKRMSNAA